MRVTVRTTDERDDASVVAVPVPTAPEHEEPDGATEPLGDDMIRIESPMVGRSTGRPSPARLPSSKSDTVETGQAMKLLNEVKAESEAVVERVCVENAAPVQYGDCDFELEPLNGRPLDAL